MSHPEVMEVMTSGSGVDDPGQGDGQLLCWGGGEFGQHGHGGNDENIGSEGALVDQVEKVVGPHHIKHVACGASHTAVVTDKDEILTWGNGNSGQLGCGEKVTHTTPQRLKLAQHDSVVAGVVCGSRHTVVWLENGRAYSCGNNFYAQLGYDFRIKNYKENQVMKERLIDQVAGRERPLEVLPHLLRPIMHRKVTQVACGEKFTLFLFDTGHVAGCGANSFGQLGTGARSEVVSPKPLEDPEEVVKIACGSCHSLAVTASGELYVWGMGRPCGSRRDDVLTPQLMMTRHSNVVSVAGGSSHSLALTANGTVYSFGGGGEGQLGHGEEVTYLTQPKPLPKNCLPGRVSQVACGDGYSAALLADGSLFMWGKSSHVIESSQPSSRKVFQPVQIPFQGRSVAMVACGAWHAAALTGKPAWQPMEEDSDASTETDEDDVGVASTEDGQDREDEGKGSAPRGQTRGSDHPFDLMEEVEITMESDEDEDTSQPAASSTKLMNPPVLPHRPAREGTRLTLEEFYSPTPLPSVRPRDLRRASLAGRRKSSLLQDEVSKEESIQDDKKPEENKKQDESDSDSDMHMQTPVEETTVKPQSPLLKKPVTIKPYIPPPPPKHAYLPRSKGVGSTSKRMLPQGTAPKVYDMSAMSGGGDGGREGGRDEVQPKFVIDKHVVIHSRKGSPSSSPSSPGLPSSPSTSSKQTQGEGRVPHQMVTTVSIMEDSRDELPNFADKAPNSMPIPKMTRAHTLYGQMKSQGKGEKERGSTLSPSIVQAVPPTAPTSSMLYKTRPPKKSHLQKNSSSVYGMKRASTSLSSVKPPAGQVGELKRQVSSVEGSRTLAAATSSSRQRPVFSSASSWRQRAASNDILLPEGVVMSSPQQRRHSTKDS